MTRRILPLLCALALLAIPSTCLAQAAWEYTPYQVRVWLALEVTPELPPQLVPPLGDSLAARSESVMGAVWSLQAEPAPAALRDDLLQRLEKITPDQIAAASKTVLSADKIYLAALTAGPQGYDLAVRELDARARQLGPVSRGQIPSLESAGIALWDLIAASFTPLAKIERVSDDQITARLRAGGLIVHRYLPNQDAPDQDSAQPEAPSPALIDKGHALRPVIRRNDRTGQPAKVGGISAVPWTLLRVEARDHSLLTCQMFSGYRGAVPSRGGVRLERLALLVSPRWDSTRIVLESRGDDPKRLAGYDVYSRSPDETEPVLLGSTDGFGSLELPRTGGSLQLLYVKNGRQLLARLPILPGQAPELTAQMADDEARLQAEGFVMALQSRALDLVARREIIAARLRARLKEGKLSDAQALLEEYRKLETRIDLRRALDEAVQGLVAGDRLTQARIDKLLADAGKLLNNSKLSDELLQQLTREVAAAQSGGAVASKNS